MNKQVAIVSEHVKEYIHSIDPYAEVILLLPQGTKMDDDVQIYVITPGKVDYVLEQQYLDARYKVELKSGKSTSLYVYSKDDWHNQFKDTPIYQKVNDEGIHL